MNTKQVLLLLSCVVSMSSLLAMEDALVAESVPTPAADHSDKWGWFIACDEPCSKPQS